MVSRIVLIKPLLLLVDHFGPICVTIKSTVEATGIKKVKLNRFISTFSKNFIYVYLVNSNYCSKKRRDENAAAAAGTLICEECGQSMDSRETLQKHRNRTIKKKSIFLQKCDFRACFASFLLCKCLVFPYPLFQTEMLIL